MYHYSHSSYRSMSKCMNANEKLEIWQVTFLKPVIFKNLSKDFTDLQKWYGLLNECGVVAFICSHSWVILNTVPILWAMSWENLFLHTYDLSRSGVNLPMRRLPLRPHDEAAKIPIFMNSDFSLLPKAKTCFPITACRRLLYLNLQQEATIELYWFSATGKSMYRLSSVNKNQRIFQTFDWLFRLC